MIIIDVMKCKDGIVILIDNEATIFKGEWMISDFNNKSVEEVKKYRRCSQKEVEVLKNHFSSGES